MHPLFCFLPALDAAYVTCARDTSQTAVASRPKEFVAEAERLRALVFEWLRGSASLEEQESE
jgi:hypothetical protein